MLTPIYDWAERHGVSHAALGELLNTLNVVTLPQEYSTDHKKGSEAWVQSKARLICSESDTLTVFRNNVGALQDKGGRQVRYGLMNDSKAVNEEYKSADLIGIRRVLITPEMIGKVIGQFTSIECKEFGWQYTGTDREPAQLRWASVINARGGLALFLDNPDNIRSLF